MRAQCAPRSPASLLLLLLLPGVGGCGDESSEGPVVTVSTQNAEVIMPEDSSGTDDKKTCTASKGSTDEILVTMGDWQIHAASFHTKATRKKPSDGEQLSEDEKLALLDDMIDDLVLSALAREAGLLSSAPAEAKLVQVLLQRKVLSEVDALHYTDAELRAWYEANRDKLVQPEQVQLGIITIRKSPRRSSEEALEQIQRIRAQLLEKPALFRDLATMYSEDPWRRRGGLPGWAPRTGKPGIEPAVLELAFKQEEGEFSHPLETSDGWVIVYTIALREAREKAWERSKGDVMREMKREKVEASRTRLLESLRSTAAVETLVDLASLELFGPLETMPQTPIARVNGEPILHIDLAKEASQSFPPGTVSLSLEERQATLQKRVDHELLVQEALRLQLEREDSVSKKLHELMEQQLLTESGSLEVTEDELFAYFQEHPEDYNRAPRVQLRRIILEINSSRSATDAMTLLESIRQESIADSNVFSIRAKEHSDGPYAPKGGSMGWVTPRPRPSLTDADLELIFQLEAGTISEPQRRDNQLVMFQIVQKTQGQTARFEDVRSGIRHKLLRERRAQYIEQALADARAQAPIVIDEAILARQAVIYCPPPELKMPSGRPPGPPQR